jgi:hypothetical protein
MNPELKVVMGEVALKKRVRYIVIDDTTFFSSSLNSLFVANSRTSFYELFSITVEA